MTLYILFCGIKREVFDLLGPNLINHYQAFFSNTNSSTSINIEFGKAFFPIQFSPSDQPFAHVYYAKSGDLGGSVGEFLYNINTEEWKLIRIRTDRDVEVKRGTYFGNANVVAEDNWRSYHNPLMIEEMTSMDQSLIPYFTEESSEANSAKKYISKVRYALMDPYTGSQWLIDIGAGRGQMLRTAYVKNIRNCLFIDADASALDVLIKRKYEMQVHFNMDREKTHHKISVYVQCLDMMDEYDKSIETIRKKMIPVPNAGANIITCYFAIHYFTGAVDALTNLMDFMDGMLVAGGSVIIMCMDGKKLFDMLADKKDVSLGRDEDYYHVIKKYKSKELENVGQQISIKLPFSQGRYYDEYLVNTEYMEAVFKKRGFILTSKASLLELERIVKVHLSPSERQFMSLHVYMVYMKKK